MGYALQLLHKQTIDTDGSQEIFKFSKMNGGKRGMIFL